MAQSTLRLGNAIKARRISTSSSSSHHHQYGQTVLSTRTITTCPRHCARVDKHAVANEDADAKSNTVFSGTAKTNDFVNWELPDSTELASYGLQVSLSNSDRYGSAQGVDKRSHPAATISQLTFCVGPGSLLPICPRRMISAKYLFGKN